MDKPAITDLKLNPLINTRWSPRSFTSRMPEKEALKRIFEAARWAPSSSNEQPWRFIVGIKGEKTWDLIFDTLVDFNQKWAHLAPVLAISIGKKMSSKSQRPNKVFSYDVGQSLAYITMQAMHEDIYVHQMGGFDTVKAADVFNVPDDFEVLTAFAMGYKGEPELLEDNFQEMETSKRQRIELKEMLFEGAFGHTSSILS